MPRKVGRPRDPRRDFYVLKYGLRKFQIRHLTETELDQIDRCKTEEARRLLLGVRDSK